MKKRLLALICAFCLSVPLVLPSLGVHARETAGEDYIWFESQMTQEEILFYNAMEKMYNEGLMKTGTGSIDMTKEGVSQAKLAAYVKGDNALALAFQNARDAFTQDYEEIFYVDFTKLTFRVGKQGNQYVAYLNNGTNENYYADGYTSQGQVDDAIVTLEAKKKEWMDRVERSQKSASLVTSTALH